jgi:hypothetical protein
LKYFEKQKKESRAAVPAWVKVGCHLPDKVKSVYDADYRKKLITFFVMFMDWKVLSLLAN